MMHWVFSSSYRKRLKFFCPDGPFTDNIWVHRRVSGASWLESPWSAWCPFLSAMMLFRTWLRLLLRLRNTYRKPSLTGIVKEVCDGQRLLRVIAFACSEIKRDPWIHVHVDGSVGCVWCIHASRFITLKIHNSTTHVARMRSYLDTFLRVTAEIKEASQYSTGPIIRKPCFGWGLNPYYAEIMNTILCLTFYRNYCEVIIWAPFFQPDFWCFNTKNGALKSYRVISCHGTRTVSLHLIDWLSNWKVGECLWYSVCPRWTIRVLNFIWLGIDDAKHSWESIHKHSSSFLLFCRWHSDTMSEGSKKLEVRFKNTVDRNTTFLFLKFRRDRRDKYIYRTTGKE